MGLAACADGSVYVSAVLDQLVENFQIIREVAPLSLTLSAMTTCGTPPLIGGLQTAL